MKDVECSEANLRECYSIVRKNGALEAGVILVCPTFLVLLSDFWAHISPETESKIQTRLGRSCSTIPILEVF